MGKKAKPMNKNTMEYLMRQAMRALSRQRQSEDERISLVSAVQAMRRLFDTSNDDIIRKLLRDVERDLRILGGIPEDGVPLSYDIQTMVEQLRKGLIHGPKRSHTGIALDSHKLASIAGAVTPFPFMELPPELRNRVYELCIPSDQTSVLRSYCGHRTGIDKPTEPHITKVSRAVRTEVLGMFYASNNFEFHAMRYGFGPFVAQCKDLSTWAVKQIRQVHIYIAEMSWGLDFEIRCAEGLWELFRWYASSKFLIGKLVCSKNGYFAPVSQAIELATRCRQEGMDGESDLRVAFDGWLLERNLQCACKASEWRDGVAWYSCSQHAPVLRMACHCKTEKE
ncbi:hypothetical protein LTR17_020873 [Elasticomyces elasticus]|nr:hypothetical protein LTR17_020873 [Elasticomyces elasticus]